MMLFEVLKWNMIQESYAKVIIKKMMRMTCPINCSVLGIMTGTGSAVRIRPRGLPVKNLQLAKDTDLSFQSDFPRSGKGLVQSSTFSYSGGWLERHLWSKNSLPREALPSK